MAKDNIARALAIQALKKAEIRYKGTVSNIGDLPQSNNEEGDEYWVTNEDSYYTWNGDNWFNAGGHVDLGNYLAKDNTSIYNPISDYNPSTKKYVNDSIYNYIGKKVQLDFNGTLENNIIIGTLSQDLQDFSFITNTEYIINLILPITTLTGDLNDNYKIILKDKDNNSINLNCIYQQDITYTSTVGNLCQIQNYNAETGYSWNFSVYYREILDNENLYRIMYTQDSVREQNTSMTGVQLYNAIVNISLKPGTTVYVNETYVANGFVFREGHTYLIMGDWTSGELQILAVDRSGLESVVDLLEIVDVAPVTTIEGQRYYNTDTKKIYTSNTSHNWTSEEEPMKGVIYFNLDTNEQYIYNGTDLVLMSNEIEASKVFDSFIGENQNQHAINEYLYTHGLPSSDFTIYGNQSSSTIFGAGNYLFLGSVGSLTVASTGNVKIVILGSLSTLTLPDTNKTVLLNVNDYTGAELNSQNTGALADGSRVGLYNIRTIDIA